MILAQMTNGVAGGGMPGPSEYAAIGWVMISLGALIVIVNGAFKLWANITGSGSRISPVPLDVRLTHEFVKKEECMARHGESVNRAQALEAQIEELRQERKVDTEILHEKVNGVAREVSELKSTTNLQNQQLARMDAKLDRLVEKRLREI